jgi:hypothetical protein
MIICICTCTKQTKVKSSRKKSILTSIHTKPTKQTTSNTSIVPINCSNRSPVSFSSESSDENDFNSEVDSNVDSLEEYSMANSVHRDIVCERQQEYIDEKQTEIEQIQKQEQQQQQTDLATTQPEVQSPVTLIETYTYQVLPLSVPIDTSTTDSKILVNKKRQIKLVRVYSSSVPVQEPLTPSLSVVASIPPPISTMGARSLSCVHAGTDSPVSRHHSRPIIFKRRVVSYSPVITALLNQYNIAQPSILDIYAQNQPEFIEPVSIVQIHPEDSGGNNSNDSNDDITTT